MAGPTNVSLKGIIDWSQQGNGGDGHPLENDINADRVDGKHYSDLKAEWIADAQASGGGGVVAFGDSTFEGGGSYRTITFSPDLGAINYVVSVMPMADTNSYVGEIWWSRVSGTQFRVYNEGSGTTAFRWSVMVQGQMPDLAGAASGDIAGNYPGPITVDGLQGRAVSSTAPSTGQVLTWDGSSWAPGTVIGGTGSTGLTNAYYTAKVLYSAKYVSGSVSYFRYVVHIPTDAFGYYHSYSGGSVVHNGPGLFEGTIPGDAVPYIISPVIYKTGSNKDIPFVLNTAYIFRVGYDSYLYTHQQSSHNTTFIGGVTRQAADLPANGTISAGNYGDSVEHDIYCA